MKKQTSPHSVKLLSLALVVAVTIIIGPGAAVSAQGPQNYKVGDRVEAKPGGTWKKATIVEIKASANAVLVSMDDEKTYDGLPMQYVTHINNVRALQETAAERPAQTAEQMADNKNDKRTAFKVGDRVEARPVSSWQKGTIVQIEHSKNAAVVRMDDEKEYTGAQREYGISVANIRALNETAEEKRAQAAKQAIGDKLFQKLRLDDKNTVLADRDILACPVEQTSVKKGARPDSALLGKLIRCLWEKPARTGMDGALTMDLTPLQIGTPRPWNPRRDLGGGPGNVVYPVKTIYTQKRFYRERIEIDEYDGVFNCSINAFGRWACGMAENKRKGESKSIPARP